MGTRLEKPSRRVHLPPASALAHQVAVTLNHGQLKTMPSLGVIVVPAPGANRVALPVFGYARLEIVEPYTVADGATWSLITHVDLFKPALSPLVPMKGALTNAGITTVIFPCGSEMFFTATPADPLEGTAWVSAVSASSPSEPNNGALYLKDDWWGIGDYTDGDPANNGLLVQEFRVLDLVNRRLLTVEESGWNESQRSFA